MDNFQEQLEKSNFLFWYKVATREEIFKAIKEHKEKLYYLIEKYKNDIDILNNTIKNLPLCKGGLRGI